MEINDNSEAIDQIQDQVERTGLEGESLPRRSKRLKAEESCYCCCDDDPSAKQHDHFILIASRLADIMPQRNFMMRKTVILLCQKIHKHRTNPLHLK